MSQEDNMIDLDNDISNDDKDEIDEKPVVKRRKTKKRSKVWLHFTEYTNEKKEKKSSCNHCGKEYFSGSKSHGTSTLKNHLLHCAIYLEKMKGAGQTSQTRLAFQGGDVDERKLIAWKFDQEEVRKAVYEMIVLDELPLKYVERRGFKRLMNIAQPLFHIPSRFTIGRDCLEMFEDEKKKVRAQIQKNIGRICLTTDTWTSIQRVNYMCLTAHYIDNEWKLKKKVINFCPITSHKGVEIGKAIEMCLLNWGFDNVFTVTMDNASSNDVAVEYLKTRFGKWKKCVLNAKWTHVTSHAFLDDITSISVILKKCLNERNDVDLYDMAKLMKAKFDKYYGNIEKFNMLVYVASILDPRNKLQYLEILLSEVYGKVDGIAILNIVKNDINELYDEYVRIHSTPPVEVPNHSSSSGKRSTPADVDLGIFNKENFRMKMKIKMGSQGMRDSKSELEKYLSEDIEDETPGLKFDILNWWRLNSPRFPILSLLARDVLAIPVSTVASESVFSTSGRVLDAFRSSLTTTMVECLICSQDWLNESIGGTNDSQDVEEDWEELQEIEQDFRKSRGDAMESNDMEA